MNVSISIPWPDLDEGDQVEARTKRANADELGRLMRLLYDLRVQPTDFVLDEGDDESSARLGRDVLDDLSLMSPYFPADDSWKAFPVQLVHDDGGALRVKVGPFRVGMDGVEMLWSAALE